MEQGDVFFAIPVFPEVMQMRKQGDVFFAMPYHATTIVPKNGMNPIRILSA
jgi:hypothetical protein